MAVLAATNLTLVDIAKRLDKSGKVADIAELLSQTNGFLQSMTAREGNLATGHRITQRVGLPDVYFRLYNKGVPSSKSRTVQMDEQCAMLVGKSTADVDLVELEGNAKAVRMDEAAAMLEAMSQKMAYTYFYGSNVNPEEFPGLSTRYSSLSASNGENILDAGGTGSDNTSVWLIGWGRNKIEGIFPKGSSAGITHTEMGKQNVSDADGNTFIAFQDEWKVKFGLSVGDWRYAVRIANIDVSTLKADPTAATIDLIALMVKATHLLPSLNGCKPVYYCNRSVRQMLDVQALHKDNVYLTVGNEEGKLKTSLRGIAIETVDQITNSESRVV